VTESTKRLCPCILCDRRQKDHKQRIVALEQSQGASVSAELKVGTSGRELSSVLMCSSPKDMITCNPKMQVLLIRYNMYLMLIVVGLHLILRPPGGAEAAG
jgi:hypothetical protein